ncbi:DNA-binding protein [Larkinella rosea]|uniref:DNA-binding protein n=1 Tax=Larkinella rosea TaxID=2025312 RepID=A0A3P1BC26_9BACT|nr:DNA-binding protein [Larkinella rosea]
MPQGKPVYPHLMDRKKAAEYLQVTAGTLAVWHSTKRHPDLKVRKIGRLVRYLKTDLDEFIDRHLRV